MRLSRTSIQKAVASVAVGSGLVAAGTASAGFVYDLRFTDGSNVKTITSAGSYDIELWGRISGTNGSHTDDAFQNSIVSILSSGNGAIQTGAVANGQVTTDFQSFSGTSPLARNGAAQELNGDGIIDWGATTTAQADTNYMLARAPGKIFGGGTVGQAVDANTWEMKIATFTINVDTLGAGGTTSFNIIKPGATAPTGVTYVAATVDGASFNVQTSNQQGAYTNSLGVSFVVASGGVTPEPASLSLLGVAAIGLLGRRRK